MLVAVVLLDLPRRPGFRQLPSRRNALGPVAQLNQLLVQGQHCVENLLTRQAFSPEVERQIGAITPAFA